MFDISETPIGASGSILPSRHLLLFHSLIETINTEKDKWSELCDRHLPHELNGSPWRYSRPMSSQDLGQGWKIHISATILTACETIKLVAPMLNESGIAFKAPATLDELRKVNSGIWYGYSQIGKFITVYPRDNEEFIELCEQLHDLTSKIGGGPAVPFDIKFSGRTNVYYRYGAFKNPATQSAFDPQKIVSPDGVQLIDRRDTAARVPDWEAHPFPEAARRSLTTSTSPLRDRYKVFRSLCQRGKGGVYEAIDMSVDPPQVRIVKEGRRNGETAWDGSDGFDRVKKEAVILEMLRNSSVEVPTVCELFETADNVYLVLEKLNGVPLQKVLERSSKPLQLDISFHFSRELADLLSRIHERGIVWRDCKPSNLFVERSGRLRALDFEGSSSVEEFDPLAWSTPDFSPPEIRTGIYNEFASSNLPEDLFALGCCLYLFFEGRMPFEDEEHVEPRPFRRTIDERVKFAVLKLLSSDVQERPSAREVARILEISK